MKRGKRERETTKADVEKKAREAEAERLLREARGKFHWEGDLKAMRRDRFESLIVIPKRRK
jgi:hypothetical protein